MSGTEPAGGGNRTVDHVAIAVHDADAATRYWVEQLGLEPDLDETLPEIGVRLLYLNAGNTMLQFVQPLRPGPIADHLAEHGEGLHHLCFVVDSIDERLAQLDGEADTQPFNGGRGRPACFLTHRPSNVLVEFVESSPVASRS